MPRRSAWCVGAGGISMMGKTGLTEVPAAACLPPASCLTHSHRPCHGLPCRTWTGTRTAPCASSARRATARCAAEGCWLRGRRGWAASVPSGSCQLLTTPVPPPLASHLPQFVVMRAGVNISQYGLVSRPLEGSGGGGEHLGVGRGTPTSTLSSSAPYNTACVCPLSSLLCQVDAAAVRQQRLSAGDGSCPVSLEMLADYEDFVRTFK